MPRHLGRHEPPDWDHLAKYPLTADTQPAKPVPVAIGVNWYVEFDDPQPDASGVFWVARDGNLTSVRGGHCVCLEPTATHEEDTRRSWWMFYDQGEEGACEGFGHSRMMSLLNRHRYDAFWLYDEARKIDGIRGRHDGTTNRAALEVLRTQGHRIQVGTNCVREHGDRPPDARQGIAAYRWAMSADDVLAVLGTPGADYVTVLNSWGESYPHRVRMPASVLDRLLSENGEAGVVTDR